MYKNLNEFHNKAELREALDRLLHAQCRAGIQWANRAGVYGYNHPITLRAEAIMRKRDLYVQTYFIHLQTHSFKD